jgi:hypothetical protein
LCIPRRSKLMRAGLHLEGYAEVATRKSSEPHFSCIARLTLVAMLPYSMVTLLNHRLLHQGSTVRSVHAQAVLLPEQRTLLLKLGFKLQDFAGQLRRWFCLTGDAPCCIRCMCHMRRRLNALEPTQKHFHVLMFV